MSIIRNILFKTTIKRALLKVTEYIEGLAKTMPEVQSFGKAVMIFSRQTQFDDLLKTFDGQKPQTWEAVFSALVLSYAYADMPKNPSNPTNYLIQNAKE
jgi:hypothetical protein